VRYITLIHATTWPAPGSSGHSKLRAPIHFELAKLDGNNGAVLSVLRFLNRAAFAQESRWWETWLQQVSTACPGEDDNMKCDIRRVAVAIFTNAILAGGCNSGSGVVEKVQAPLYEADPGTVTPGTPSTRAATCPGHKLPDQCGSWQGVELTATASFPPENDNGDQHCLCNPIPFQVPASIPVTQGNAGFGDAVLAFRKTNGHFDQCLYRGNARVGRFGKVTGGDAYALVGCSDGSRAGGSETADWFSLELSGGDPFRGPTEVQLRLGAPDVVNGVVQEEILYASDSRIPNAALHIPRGSAPPNQSFTFAVLSQPAVGSTISNGGDPFTTTGFGVDVHATGVSQFNFTPVPGAACPSIDLPYSPATLLAVAGTGGEDRLRARQITDLSGLTTGASVLAQTSAVTVDPTNQIVSFCVAHLSYYVSGTGSFDSELTGATLTGQSCTTVNDCDSTTGWTCNAGACYVDLLNTTPTPQLAPGRKYVLLLNFENTGPATWDAGAGVSLASVTSGTPPEAMVTSPWFPGLPVQYTQSLTGSVMQNSTATFTVNVTAPMTGGILDLCLNKQFTYFGECFSWDPPHSMTLFGTTPAPVCSLNACGGCDTLAIPLGAACGSGAPSCIGAGTYVCNGLNSTTCQLPPLNACGGCSTLSQTAGSPCDNGEQGACLQTGVIVCNGTDSVACNAPQGTTNACGGCSTLPQSPGSPCDNGEQGACFQTGVIVCNGTDSVACNAPQGTPTPEVCDGIDNDCNGVVDDVPAVACGSCGGTQQCGPCSIPTPTDFGDQQSIVTAVSVAGFSFTDEIKDFPTDAGWELVGCTETISGNVVAIGRFGPNGECEYEIESGEGGLGGGTVTVTVVEQRGCD
jgi:hypothetical protein